MLTVDYRSLSTVSVLIIPLCLLPSDLELPQPKVSKGFTTASTTLALVTLSFLLAVSFLDTGRHSCSSTLGVASPSSSWASLCLPFSLSLWVCSIKCFTFFFHFLTMNSQDSVMTSLPPHQRLPKDSSFFTASPIISKTLAPTLPPSLFLEKSSPLVTVPPHTVSQLPLASSVPSSPKLAFPNW